MYRAKAKSGLKHPKLGFCYAADPTLSAIDIAEGAGADNPSEERWPISSSASTRPLNRRAHKAS